MANFMLIFRGGDPSGDSPEQMQQYMQKWFDWFQALAKAGAYHGEGNPLEPGGKTLRGKRRVVSDGPFSESKDVVGGYAVIQAKDLDVAVEIARGCPALEKGGDVEVRPVREMAVRPYPVK